MKALSGTDLRRACLVPSSVFTSPEEVVASARLSLAQKLTILRRWEFDARRVAGFASSESQAAGLLQQVRRALQAVSEGTVAAQEGGARRQPDETSPLALPPRTPDQTGLLLLPPRAPDRHAASAAPAGLLEHAADLRR